MNNFYKINNLQRQNKFSGTSPNSAKERYNYY